MEVDSMGFGSFGVHRIADLAVFPRFNSLISPDSTHSFSTTIFAHSLHMKHLPPQRKVISCVVTLQHVQHQTGSKRAKKSGFFSIDGKVPSWRGIVEVMFERPKRK